jgi:ferredoxin-nitrite reductase
MFHLSGPSLINGAGTGRGADHCMGSQVVTEGFTDEQKEYLQGFFAGLSARKFTPFVGTLPDGLITASSAPGLKNEAAAADSSEQTVFGTPVSDLCEQEIWKLEQHGLDIWDKLLAHATENRFPDKADTFRFRYHGLFYVAPNQNSFMLRCRVPGGQLTGLQLRGLADIADDWGVGPAAAAVLGRADLAARQAAGRVEQSQHQGQPAAGHRPGRTVLR